ncbi:glycosyltransferase family 4 protein [Corynebacterium sp. MSK008]|uniref:glycosyltransferase family 4 protein n=1 Tax=Corynebacterium sp. MSK008 TaxID=3050188 RepID=UPI00254F94A0|nr:glycosyltransferase family 4 protein [Corynebacterium sp. MSK008]MDK8879613.1 glycosyltransferase family 4 protein [Corynebacterium sp. MSK008]
MRIGLVCPYSFNVPGGVQAHVLDLAAQLRDMGHHTEVLGPASSAVTLPEWVTRGGAAVPVRYNGSVARLSFGPQVRRTTRQFIERGNFDILHVHEPNSPSYSMAALRMATGPIVATYHASAESSYALKLALPALRGSLEKIRAGVAVSDEAWRWQSEQVGTDPVIIPNGVDTGRFAAARRVSGHRARPEVVFLGRLDEPRKGLDVFLQAIDRLPKRPRVTVIGAGAPREVEGVEFTGRISEAEKAKILGRADIFVAPNLGGESFGIILVEAMAAGCAVIASDIPAFAAVCGEDAGVLFPPGDASALARKLQLLIDDVPLRTNLASHGVQRARDFDWSVVARQVLAVYEAVSIGEKVGVEGWL